MGKGTVAIHEDIAAFLASHADEGYRAFQAKLIPNIDAATIVGVRTPERFLPFADNWATCDQLSCRGLAANPDAALVRVRAWLESDHEYTVRFAIGVLLQLFLDERFRPEFFEWVVAVSRPEYYVNMMRAWYFAEALAKQPAVAERVIASGALDEWTHNKAIQKAIESRRIPFEQKGRLRALKRRS